MRPMLQLVSTAFFLIVASLPAPGQSPAPLVPTVEQPISGLPPVAPALDPVPRPAPSAVPPAVQQLVDFRDTNVKFELPRLMETLRDRRHEGWVLAAYPDPKTSRPLIGAGFSLDLPAREHQQRDPLNPHPFLEPSSAELWQAAGLDAARLQRILDEYSENLKHWKAKRFRKQIGTLSPQITDQEATGLLRVAAIQAIYNARAYCRNFDQLTASQQMALSQMVYQMGVNLGEFTQFLGLINRAPDDPAAPVSTTPADPAYWRNVQLTLVQSQWARLYRGRATSVIAMLDPQYSDEPSAAERRISTVLHPAAARRRGRSASVRLASYTRRHGAMSRKRASRARKN